MYKVLYCSVSFSVSLSERFTNHLVKIRRGISWDNVTKKYQKKEVYTGKTDGWNKHHVH